MTDRYQSLAHHPIGKFVVKNLGLPNPPELERWSEGSPLVKGTVLIGAASGLVEPVFALLCAWLVGIAELLLPLGLAFAAGAMLLVVTQEIIPESRRNGHEKIASLGLISGFCLMMVMDTALA